MQYSTKQVLRHFLKDHIRLLKKSDSAEIHPFLKGFLSHQELIDIIKWLMDDVALRHVDLENSSGEELLEVIYDDVSILEYFMEAWETEAQNRERLTATSVWDTLTQLGHETHYLGSKPLAQWDGYDHANYRSLQRKSGRVKLLWGIYDTTVSQEHIAQVTTPPKRYFDTYQQAEAEKERLLKTQQLPNDALHILQIYQAV